VTCGATAGNGRGIGLGLLAFEAWFCGETIMEENVLSTCFASMLQVHFSSSSVMVTKELALVHVGVPHQYWCNGQYPG
jgi:hypothetical protein